MKDPTSGFPAPTTMATDNGPSSQQPRKTTSNNNPPPLLLQQQRQRENLKLKLQVNSLPAVPAQQQPPRVNGNSHTVITSSSTHTIMRVKKPPTMMAGASRGGGGSEPVGGGGDGVPTPVKKKRMCARCATQLGRFFNTGAPCPSCGLKTCSDCRVKMYRTDRKKTWICTFCAKERQAPRKNPNDLMQRRNSLLKRNPLPLMIANEALLTMPRNGKHQQHSPVSNRISYQGSLPRNFTTTSEPPQMGMGNYNTATRGRPVATPGTPNAKKRAPAPPKKPERNFQVVTAPATDLEMGKFQSATLGKPVKNLLSPMAAKRWEATADVVTTLRRAKPSPPVVLKEKYIHIEVTNVSANQSRSSVTFNQPGFLQSSSTDSQEMHPKLLNGGSGNVKSATIDRIYNRRHTTSFEDSMPSVSTTAITANNAVPAPRRRQEEPLPNPPSTSSSKIATSSSTLPRVLQKVRRAESLSSTHSRDPDQSLSLLNLTHTGPGQPASEVLTTPQPGLVHNAGLRHPSYSTFSRSDSRRKSFMDRASVRRSSSFKVEDPLYKVICNAVQLEYDDFLTAVIGHLKIISECHLTTVSEPTPAFSRRYSNRRITVQAEISRLPSFPYRRSSVPSLTMPENPYDALLSDQLVPRRLSSPDAEFAPVMAVSPEEPPEALGQFVRGSSIRSSIRSGRTASDHSNLSRKSSFSASLSSETEVSVRVPDLQRHVSIIEINPETSSTGSNGSAGLRNSKNVFEVTAAAPDVEVVLQQIPETGEIRARSSGRFTERFDKGSRDEDEPKLDGENRNSGRLWEDFADGHRTADEPAAVTRSSGRNPNGSSEGSVEEREDEHVVRARSSGRFSDRFFSEHEGKAGIISSVGTTEFDHHEKSTFVGPTPPEDQTCRKSSAESPEPRTISPAVAFVKSPEVKPRKSLANGLLKPEPSGPSASVPEEALSTEPPAPHSFVSHVQSAQTEIAAILSGVVPKRRMAPRPPPVVPISSKPKEDGIAEFQRVLGNLREAKKPADMVVSSRAKPIVDERLEERGNEVQNVAAAIQHFKKVNEEVQDLKDFLKAVRQSPKPPAETEQKTHASSHATIHPSVIGVGESQQRTNISDSEKKFDTEHNGLPEACIPISDHGIGTQKALPEDELANGQPVQNSSVPMSSIITAPIHNEPLPTPNTTAFEYTSSEPLTRDPVPSSPSPSPSPPPQKDAHRPERAKWHSSLLPDELHITLNNGHSESPYYIPTHTPTDESVSSPTAEDLPSLPAKKCIPAAVRPAFFSQGSSDTDGEEERAEFDFEDESNSSAYSDDGIPAVKACRKVELDDEQLGDPLDAVETWEMAPQPVPGDIFGRLQVPLDSIQEESEDEDRESKFTRTINRKAMRPVVSLDMSPDEADEDMNGWHMEEEGDDGQSDLEQYFITGLLQPTAVNSKPYFRSDMDFDALEEGDVTAAATTVRKEPSIFGSAKLKFAAASDYRLSSDMDDLSASSPSDDESFY
ncbi:hypothetical protein BV898_04146 [Hypsibius exemplaris]|uniref:FYVE-type domain-containing protein n=1 Tax=Hypsibius exemplaris TaxID=2072580 RepID=A0A1W0X367_HYPEX|nr:hypothetical protein BV898_04146 [Hypsibius exemplaris]